jgi:hypothetical protein
MSLYERDVFAGEPAQHAVHMLFSEAKVIADLLLRQVQVECRPRDQPTPPKAVIEVDQHRGNALGCFEAGNPNRAALRSPTGHYSENRRPRLRFRGAAAFRDGLPRGLQRDPADHPQTCFGGAIHQSGKSVISA